MPLTEAEIVAASEAFIKRLQLSALVFVQGEIFPKPILSVLLAYEEEMRRLHEAAEPSDLTALLEHHRATERENAQLRADIAKQAEAAGPQVDDRSTEEYMQQHRIPR